MTKWQPIETAPKDGTNFLGYWPDLFNGDNGNATPVKTWWGDGYTGPERHGWNNPYEFALERNELAPTHWQPLPDPPTD